jgi:hypothetical protein
VKLYRVMKVAADGKPLVGTRRNMLGVRPTDPTNTDPKRRFDAVAVNDGDAIAPGEGLSTSLNPGRMRVGADEALFEIETDDLAPGLVPNPDHPPHCLIEPSGVTTLGEFQQALADTRDLWHEVQ